MKDVPKIRILLDEMEFADENDELTSLSDGEYLDDYSDDYDDNSDDEF